ncbi:hypothetical protein B0H11DRAFT_1912168 [Mycena galericulata]|nr:hypothetical protein B0H11DRAFT_1912168 [Mycena galericulata]
MTRRDQHYEEDKNEEKKIARTRCTYLPATDYGLVSKSTTTWEYRLQRILLADGSREIRSGVRKPREQRALDGLSVAFRDTMSAENSACFRSRISSSLSTRDQHPSQTRPALEHELARAGLKGYLVTSDLNVVHDGAPLQSSATSSSPRINQTDNTVRFADLVRLVNKWTGKVLVEHCGQFPIRDLVNLTKSGSSTVRIMRCRVLPIRDLANLAKSGLTRAHCPIQARRSGLARCWLRTRGTWASIPGNRHTQVQPGTQVATTDQREMIHRVRVKRGMGGMLKGPGTGSPRYDRNASLAPRKSSFVATAMLGKTWRTSRGSGHKPPKRTLSQRTLSPASTKVIRRVVTDWRRRGEVGASGNCFKPTVASVTQRSNGDVATMQEKSRHVGHLRRHTIGETEDSRLHRGTEVAREERVQVTNAGKRCVHQQSHQRSHFDGMHGSDGQDFPSRGRREKESRQVIEAGGQSSIVNIAETAVTDNREA